MSVEPKTTDHVLLCVYERRMGTALTLGSQRIAGPNLSPYGQPDRTYKVSLRQLREIIASAERTGEPE
ncbi:hypothetical protein ACQKIE_09800 [Luteibacter sp. NPDC031894]|uniref:hypothetical protein n=1 Tax=Luteibacter sp. NPDC031894 TaxID=3390572 RepID=UPI003CFEAA39